MTITGCTANNDAVSQAEKTEKNRPSIASSFVLFILAAFLSVAAALFPLATDAQTSGHAPKMATEVPPGVATPDSVETSLGTLKFFDGSPNEETVTKVYDNLDLIRGVDVFLNTQSAASTLANIEGLKSVSGNNQTVVVHEDRVDAKTLLLTPNTQTVTLWGYLNLKDGPMVVEIPPGVLGLADDMWMRYIVDLGLVGQDKGKGESIYSCRQTIRGLRPMDIS